MPDNKDPFVFYSRLHLIELTGIKANSLPGLLEHLKTVSGSCIYHHTHHFVQRHQYLSPEPANDFAYWVTEMLGDEALGEELASIDIMSHPSIRSIRESLVTAIEKALRSRSRLRSISVAEGQEFFFLKSVSFIFSTGYSATDLAMFKEGLKLISISSIYFHMYESRLRLERSTNDFSNWLSNSLGENELAVKIARLDPYTSTGESLRNRIIELVEARLKRSRSANAAA